MTKVGVGKGTNRTYWVPAMAAEQPGSMQGLHKHLQLRMLSTSAMSIGSALSTCGCSSCCCWQQQRQRWWTHQGWQQHQQQRCHRGKSMHTSGLV
jgi:hypothetical protein